ncbi:exodeoxyribonuclease V subunit gamma [Ramlibacter alkalitolerans]|uniref:RecBCD enzyme subunit RecC n=1 Tax=Ramlibacter alkalitolerans TaxID=2039631 RepID=A0ABS1JQV0_9BURK|nr:exodeoxyribonuclease V subunit gamma [Ramlibacter alkalitolerans]MBL0426649.1 exodeoxyribonuclease V subunit gamma [Ramlibacter alkalitolerans]
MNDGPQSLPPGFMVVHGNHPEALRNLMVAWMARHPLAPLEDERILVQSNGVAQWLKLSLAADPRQGGIGVAAALRTQLPAHALWDAYRAVLGPDAVPRDSALDESRVVWRLMRLLPALLPEPEFAPLRGFLHDDADRRKLHQLALRVADLLDQYQVYRADWLARWAAGDAVLTLARGGLAPVPETLRWQPRLWQALLADVGDEGAAGGRAEVHRRFLDAVQGWQGAPPAGLPRRISVFGISSLPRQALDALAALARFSQVLLFVHNPSEHDWSGIVAPQDAMRRRRHQPRPGLRGEPGLDALHLQTQPLLAAWGKQGRDFVGLLEEYDRPDTYRQRFGEIGQRIDLFERTAGDTLLRQLQDDILDLRPIAETQSRWPPVDPARDTSIAFHVTHSPQREVEVLHDQLLAAFAADPTLRPRDVIVMVPDVSVYAPHIRAVFGLAEDKDPRHIPFNVADQGQRQQDPLLGALEKLLNLPRERIAVSEVLDLLDVPALRSRFGIAEDDLALLHTWIASARIRWGLHAQHRASLGLPPDLERNSWRFGLRRMLLGYAAGQGEAWNGIEPLAEVGGLDAALLGPLVRLMEKLEAHWALLDQPAPPAVWVARLQQLLDDFFAAREGSVDGLTLLRAQSALDDWQLACEEAQLAQPLPLSVVREHWLQSLEAPGLGQPFFAGGVTFASLMPMRAIPFRRIALLGMNDGDYPRSRPPMDFDLMAHEYRPGDRSRREDDRYLFLEALLSAREHLHVSWVGRSIHDNEERPPSVLVAQLRDHLAAGWRAKGAKPDKAGRELVAALTVQHRLQPFHRAYFDGGDPRLFSYASEWGGSLQAPAAGASGGVLDAAPAQATLTLAMLGRFARNPVRAFFEHRLAVRFADEDVAAQDQEPFGLDALENWSLQDELIRVQRAAIDAGAPREPALQERLARFAARGELPHGAFAAQVAAQLAEPMDSLFARYAQFLQDWPRVLPDEPLAFADRGGPPPLLFEDWLSQLRGNGDGARCRLVLESSGLVKDRRWRLARLLPHWVAHVAGHLAGQPLTTIVVSKAGCATLPAMAHAAALAWWQELLQAWREGMRRPLPFCVDSAAAWLRFIAPEKGEPAPERAREEARKCHEAECGRDPYLARAFPDFDAFHGDEFAHWAVTLLRPLRDAVGAPPKGDAP